MYGRAAALGRSAASQACSSAHTGAGTGEVLGPKMAAVLWASGVERSKSNPAGVGLSVTPN